MELSSFRISKVDFSDYHLDSDTYSEPDIDCATTTFSNRAELQARDVPGPEKDSPDSQGDFISNLEPAAIGTTSSDHFAGAIPQMRHLDINLLEEPRVLLLENYGNQIINHPTQEECLTNLVVQLPQTPEPRLLLLFVRPSVPQATKVKDKEVTKCCVIN